MGNQPPSCLSQHWKSFLITTIAQQSHPRWQIMLLGRIIHCRRQTTFPTEHFPPLTFPSDGFNVNDCDALGPDKNSDGDTSISSDSSNNESNDRDDGGGDKVRARPAEFPSAQP